MSNSTLREALQRLVSRIDARAAYGSVETDELEDVMVPARAALAADDAARGTMRKQFEARWVITMDADDAARQASQAAAPQSVEPVWYRWRYNGEWHSGPTPLLREDQTHVEALCLAPPVAPTDAEWQEEAMRLADALSDAVRRAPRSVSASEHRDALRAHIATRPLPAPPTKKEQP